MADRKYGHILSDRKEFPPDEPLFVLRAQDLYADATVRFYATLRAAGGDATGAAECMKIADDLARWAPRRRPT